MAASAANPSSQSFIEVAQRLAFLSAEQAAQLNSDAAARQSSPSQVALQKGLLTVTQIDIVETLLRPTDTIPGYEILDVLGQGGMGVVYRARQLNLKRIVALKTVLVNRLGDAGTLQRFQQEAEAVARLAHPHIIAAYDLGQCDGRLYFAMELVAGDDVHELIARYGPLHERMAWGLVRQAAAGLAHAAEQGIVHRDIKPANLLLVEPPAGFPLPPGMPLVKIADFGLARLAAAAEESPRLTTAGMTVGSPLYMPPEQLRGEPVDQRADIFALGASAFHMLAGNPSLAGKNLSQICAHRLSNQPEPVEEFRPDVSAASAELVAAMMAPGLDERIGDYRELVRRIDAVLGTRAVGEKLGQESETIAYLPLSTGALGAIPTGTTQLLSARRPNTLSRASTVRKLSIALVALAALLVLLGTLGRRESPGERTLVEAGPGEPLFNGRSLNQWRTVSGGWVAAKNDEGATVLEGRGAVRRSLAVHGEQGETQPLEHYRLTLVVDLHQATAAELLFDLGGADGRSLAVRIDQAGSSLGQRRSERDTPRWEASLPHSSDRPDMLHAIQIERQERGWWVFVDDRFLGSLPLAHDPPAAEFGLAAEGGPACFSDITVEELLPATHKE